MVLDARLALLLMFSFLFCVHAGGPKDSVKMGGEVGNIALQSGTSAGELGGSALERPWGV